MARFSGLSRASTPALVYLTMAAVAVVVAAWRGENPLVTEGQLDLPEAAAHVASLGLGVLLAIATVWATRRFGARWGSVRLLHAQLRPSVRHASESTLLLLGVASAFSEELLFRGVLLPVVGLSLSAIAFGLLHQARGRARWLWMIWASVMGGLFGLVFWTTGSLVGALAAHAIINVLNLRYVRDTDVEPRKPRHLGGLLGRV